MGGNHPLVYIAAGATNGGGSLITDFLDNIDPTNDKYKTTEEMLRDASTNAKKGMIYSIPGAFIGWGVNGANSNPGTAQELMPTYSRKLGEGLNQFYGMLDNLLLAEESLNGDSKKIKENAE